MNKKLFEFIKKSPSAYHSVSYAAKKLDSFGFERLSESSEWKIEASKGYYVTRNSSSLIAFRVPEKINSFMMSASHSDSPCFKIKENAEIKDKLFVKLSVERYGGMLMAPWFDRPLSVAGRIVIRNGDGITVKNVDLERPVALIPSVAIHMNRSANENAKYDPAADMLPLYSSDGNKGLKELIAEKAEVEENDIISTDLFVYAPDEGVEWGDYISAPRLDDLQCAFASLEAFTSSSSSLSAPVYCLFDNEEVGSSTKQGADSTFLYDTLKRLCDALGYSNEDYMKIIAGSFLLSCDNAHSVHPNHPELSDKNHTVAMNEGIVIKYNANQKYTSDAVSSALFRMICEKAGVPFQLYANRADMAGGSTLGNIANTHVSLNTVDIGLPQLAMHSCFETAGAKDTEYMVKALKVFFSSGVICDSDGEYRLLFDKK